MGGLLDHKYKGMTAEKVYSILVKDEEALEDAINQINQQKPNGENSDEEQDAAIVKMLEERRKQVL